MCNIAGYVGNRQAAPILIEMLKRQEVFDGGYSTGIVTIHEGKFYCKRILGNVEEFLKSFDLSELPGTIGLAHTRPYNNQFTQVHPYISNNGKVAVVTNGTGCKPEFIPRKEALANMLLEKGFDFVTRFRDDESNYPKLKDGYRVSVVDIMTNLTQFYMDEGMECSEAFTKAADNLTAERIYGMVCADEPDSIKICRISRPMEILMADGESYIATTRFGFPEDVKGDVMSLPVLHTCKVKKGSFEITPHSVKSEKVADITPATYIKAYNKIEEMLKGGKEKPCIWDDIELAMLAMPELWNEQNNYSQYAKVGYDILWQLKEEGRLKSFLAPQSNPWKNADGVRTLSHMYID